MRCFLDHDRSCSPDVQENERPRCRMWDVEQNECKAVLLVDKYKDVLITYTSFPDSAPPPEVK